MTAEGGAGIQLHAEAKSIRQHVDEMINKSTTRSAQSRQRGAYGYRVTEGQECWRWVSRREDGEEGVCVCVLIIRTDNYSTSL